MSGYPKTLRDLEKTQPEYDESYNIVGVERLRQEAILWAKHLEKSKTFLIKTTDNYEECIRNYDYMIHWIRNFFEIKKSELK